MSPQAIYVLVLFVAALLLFATEVVRDRSSQSRNRKGAAPVTQVTGAAPCAVRDTCTIAPLNFC